MKKTTSGFTIVELLIVIVIIAILATITVVVFNGVQIRARDTKRLSDLANVSKAIELYKAANGNYPQCGTATAYTVGGAISTNEVVTCLTTALVPQFTSSLPTDPKNTGNSIYYYAVGCRDTGTGVNCNNSANYVLGTTAEDTAKYGTAYTWSAYTGSGPSSVSIKRGTNY